MALINCKECTTEFSDLAAACPKCGAPTAYSKGSAAVSISKDNTPAPYSPDTPVVIDGTARTVTPETPPVQQATAPQQQMPQQQAPQQQMPQQAAPPQYATPPQQAIPPQGYPPQQQHMYQPGTQPFQMHQQIIINTPAPQQQIRYIGSLLLIGIFFFPWIFYWFLFREGHTNFARVAGFIWLVLCTAAFLVVDYGVYEKNKSASEEFAELASANATDSATSDENTGSQRESILYQLAHQNEKPAPMPEAEPAPVATPAVDMDAFNEPATAPVDPADQAISDAVQAADAAAEPAANEHIQGSIFTE